MNERELNNAFREVVKTFEAFLPFDSAVERQVFLDLRRKTWNFLRRNVYVPFFKENPLLYKKFVYEYAKKGKKGECDDLYCQYLGKFDDLLSLTFEKIVKKNADLLTSDAGRRTLVNHVTSFTYEFFDYLVKFCKSLPLSSKKTFLQFHVLATYLLPTSPSELAKITSFLELVKPLCAKYPEFLTSCKPLDRGSSYDTLLHDVVFYHDDYFKRLIEDVLSDPHLADLVTNLGELYALAVFDLLNARDDWKKLARAFKKKLGRGFNFWIDVNDVDATEAVVNAIFERQEVNRGGRFVKEVVTDFRRFLSFLAKNEEDLVVKTAYGKDLKLAPRLDVLLEKILTFFSTFLKWSSGKYPFLHVSFFNFKQALNAFYAVFNFCKSEGWKTLEEVIAADEELKLTQKKVAFLKLTAFSELTLGIIDVLDEKVTQAFFTLPFSDASLDLNEVLSSISSLKDRLISEVRVLWAEKCFKVRALLKDFLWNDAIAVFYAIPLEAEKRVVLLVDQAKEEARNAVKKLFTRKKQLPTL